MKKPTQIDSWGILSKFKDAFGKWRSVSTETRKALRQAMGDPENPAGAIMGLRIIKQGSVWKFDQPAELTLEDGSVMRVEKRTPKDLPCGYHELKDLASGQRLRLMVTPGACFLPAGLHRWGWAVQLYALRSSASWGIGDLGDLKKFGRWAAREHQCGFCLINPVGATTPILPQQASPYYPSSRCFWNPLYLRLEDVPGAHAAGISIDELARAAKALNSRRLIDRDEVFRLKWQALEKLWKRFCATPEFERFCQTEGPVLIKFAAFCSLAHRFDCGWPQWPAKFRSPDSPAVQKYIRENGDDIRFHQWLQWLLHRQLKNAATEIPIIQDLPIGVDPAGADAWLWQDLLAQRIHVGAPPDVYNAQGQDWGMQPFNPHRLRAAFFEPFRLTVRAALRFGGGLRIDHVMGLFRLFWIPAGQSGEDGAYVHYPAEELLAILAIESHRARALVIGEDLGTVEPAMRQELRRRNVLSYRLLWFEENAIRQFPKKALTAVSTHDLFTLAGLWSGADFAEQEKLGLRPSPGEQRRLVKKLCRRIGIAERAELSEVILKTHQYVAQAPSMLLAASLDDVLAVKERPNMPGTTNRPNWSLALPLPLEEIQKSPLVKKISRTLGKTRKK
jgi:4-alpha-glucanotransferase